MENANDNMTEMTERVTNTIGWQNDSKTRTQDKMYQ